MSNSRRPMLTVLVTVVTIIVNALANALPLNGQTTGEISNRLDVYFTPAPYVFSIWGAIYLGLVAFSVYQARPAQRNNRRLAGIRGWYLLSCAANSAWIVLWHYEVFLLTVVAMLALLVSLIAIYLRLGIGRRNTPHDLERWVVDIPFRIYLGWITVATVANIAAYLGFIGWRGDGISEVGWTIVMLIVAALLASAVAADRGDMAYAVVIAWAYIGIVVANTSVGLIALVAAALAPVPLMIAAARAFRR